MTAATRGGPESITPCFSKAKGSCMPDAMRKFKALCCSCAVGDETAKKGLHSRAHKMSRKVDSCMFALVLEPFLQ